MEAAGEVDFRGTCGVQKREDAGGFLPTGFGDSPGSQPRADGAALEREGHGAEFAAGEIFSKRRNERGQPFILGAEDFGGSGNGFAKGGAEGALDGGEDFVAEFVARVERLGVGGILAERDAVELAVAVDLVTGNGEQRAVEGESSEKRDGLDAGESGGSGAAEEIEKAGLDLVVRVVGKEESAAAVADCVPVLTTLVKAASLATSQVTGTSSVAPLMRVQSTTLVVSGSPLATPCRNTFAGDGDDVAGAWSGTSAQALNTPADPRARRADRRLK